LKRKIWIPVLVAGLCVLFAGMVVFSAENGGMSIGLMGVAEQANIMNVRFIEGAPTGDAIKVTIRNNGVAKVAIQEGYANEIKATNINSGQAFIIPKASSLEITLTFPNGTLVSGTQQQVKLITTKGNTLVYSLTYDSTSTSKYNPLIDDVSPTPIQETTSTPDQFWTPYLTTVVIVTSGVAMFSVLGACKLAHYIVGPKNKTELFVLLFFVSVIVVSVIVAIVNIVFFPPQITL
jgi:hypothetical protein